MPNVRVVGTHKRPGRCVYCRDALDALVHRCSACGVSVHLDCLEELGDRCPTVGCGGSEGAARASREERRARRERHRERREAPADGALERWAREAQERSPPGAAARLGPYLRLILSGLAHVALLAAIVALLCWVVVDPAAAWETLKTDEDGNESPFIGVVMCLGASAAAVFGGVTSTLWLARWPGVWREVGRLLDGSRPVPMRLSVRTTGSGKHKRTHASLEPVSEGASEARFQVSGLLPPRWLRKDRVGTPVLVYGIADQDPPYLIENGAGRLALVHPD